MSTSKTLFGTAYAVPARKERSWGVVMSALIGVMVDGLQGLAHKYAGGNHTLKLSTAANTLAADAVLTPTAAIHKVQGDGGAVTLNTTTPIAAGEADGVVLILIGQHGTNTVTITEASSNVTLTADAALITGDTLTLVWDATTSKWSEIARSIE